MLGLPAFGFGLMWIFDLFTQYRAIERREWPKVLLLSTFFFLVIGTYWILKPIKRGLIISFFESHPLTVPGASFTGAEAEQIAKLVNPVFAFIVVLLFTWLTRRVIRYRLVLAISTVFGAAFAGFSTLIDKPNALLVLSFYVFGDIYNTAMVVLFWAFTNDLASEGEAKRTYGLIGAGGVVGGFVGATVVRGQVQEYGRAPLLLLCVVPMMLIAIIALSVRRFESAEPAESADTGESERHRSSVASEGARLVLKSRYLLAIAGIVGIYEFVSNVVDFQLAVTVEEMISQPLERDAYFALVGQVIGIGSIGVQLLLTSYLLSHFGVRISLMILPLAIGAASTGFLVAPALAFAAAMSASDNALNYSINQSAKEVLYTPTAPDVTYRAKAFIDMFVQRSGKVLSVVLNLFIIRLAGGEPRWLSLISLGMIAAWLMLIEVAALRFRALVREPETERPSQAGRGHLGPE